MAGFMPLTIWMKVATAVMCYAVGLQVAGLATPNWCRTSLSQMGLFYPAKYLPTPVPFKDPNDTCILLSRLQPVWLYVVRLTIFFATIQSVATTLIFLVYTCVPRFYGQRKILLFIVVEAFIIVLFNSIGCMVFILDISDSQYYSWSFIEIICAIILTMVTAILVVSEIRKISS